MIGTKKWTRGLLFASLLLVIAAIAHGGDAEDVFWDSVVKGNAREEYELYLKQYPKGRHVGEARQNLEAIREKARAQQDARKQKPVQTETTKRIEEELKQKEAELRRRENELRQREVAEAGRRRAEQVAERQRAEQTAMRAGQVFRDCADCPEMVVIPAGSFEMGSTNGDADERPVHTVRIGRPFAIGKTEVTQAHWRSVMGNNPSQFIGCDDCPVESVSWHDAQDFVRSLSQKTGKTYRLPSEAEWEYACRAGNRQEYCGSDSADTVAWSRERSNGRTHVVAGKQPNAWGLYDMSGNVWEWVEDCGNDHYIGAPTDGSAWTSGNCATRVNRGGSWYGSTRAVRSAIRFGYIAKTRFNINGFRLARMLP